MASAHRNFLSAWGDWHVEAEEYVEIDSERILVPYRFTAHGKRSGLEIGGDWGTGASLFEIRQGLVTRLVNYFDRDHALADLGLEEQATAEESTTPDRLDALRRLADALGRRDLDAAVAMFASDAVFDTAAAGGLGLVYEGGEEIRGFLEAWIGPFEDYEEVVKELRDLDNGVVLTLHLQRGRPRGSSGFVEQRFAAVSIWHDGLIERLATYADTDEARAAAERLDQERG
jgi:ketosteroid isomerase-like protein